MHILYIQLKQSGGYWIGIFQENWSIKIEPSQMWQNREILSPKTDVTTKNCKKEVLNIKKEEI